MIEMQVDIENLDELRSNFQRSPGITLKYLARATKASILDVEKQSVDRNFQFKTPRSQRTGFLQKSFSSGRYISPDGLQASIGPTVRYAPAVYYGKNGRPGNKYMDRIARAAEPAAVKHFNRAVDRIAQKLSQT